MLRRRDEPLERFTRQFHLDFGRPALAEHTSVTRMQYQGRYFVRLERYDHDQRSVTVAWYPAREIDVPVSQRRQLPSHKQKRLEEALEVLVSTLPMQGPGNANPADGSADGSADGGTGE